MHAGLKHCSTELYHMGAIQNNLELTVCSQSSNKQQTKQKEKYIATNLRIYKHIFPVCDFFMTSV